MARDVHDVLGQQLTALRYDAAWLRRRLAEDEVDRDAVARRIGDLDAGIEALICAVQSLATELRLPGPGGLALGPALEGLAARFEARTGVRCEVSVCPAAAAAAGDEAFATAIYRIVQEALTNVARHAQASRAEVVLAVVRGEVTVCVSDDGVGLSPEAGGRQALGLLGMHERAAEWGGRVDVGRRAGGGVRVGARFPLPGLCPSGADA